MGTELKMGRTYTFKIDNFSDRNDQMMTDPFSSGGCEWYVIIEPKGCPGYGHADNHLSLFLGVFNHESLRLGWQRRARFFFVILNHSGKEFRRTNAECSLFCAETFAWGSDGLLPLTEVLALENNTLTIEVFVEVEEVDHQGQSTEIDLSEYPKILDPQALSAFLLIEQHPNYDVDFVPKYPELRAVYRALLFSLIGTLSKSPQSLSLAELTNARCQLTELTKAGFKLDFLESKLEVLSLERKKADVQLEERVKNVELALEKIKYASAARVSSFGFIDFLIKRFFLSCFS